MEGLEREGGREGGRGEAVELTGMEVWIFERVGVVETCEREKKMKPSRLASRSYKLITTSQSQLLQEAQHPPSPSSPSNSPLLKNFSPSPLITTAPPNPRYPFIPASLAAFFAITLLLSQSRSISSRWERKEEMSSGVSRWSGEEVSVRV